MTGKVAPVEGDPFFLFWEINQPLQTGSQLSPEPAEKEGHSWGKGELSVATSSHFTFGLQFRVFGCVIVKGTGGPTRREEQQPVSEASCGLSQAKNSTPRGEPDLANQCG